MPVYLQDLTTGGHTWAHHGALPVFCQWSGSGPVSGLMETSHRAHRRSEGQRTEGQKKVLKQLELIMSEHKPRSS